MVPDLDASPRPVRYLILAPVVLGPLLLAVTVLVGTASSPTVVVEATVVDAPPVAEDDVYRLSGFAEESPTRAAVEEALRDGSVTATAEEVRSAPEFYVRHDEQVVRVEMTRE
jgi:hypothetical protein